VKKVKLYARLLEQEDTMHIAVIYLNVVEVILSGILNKTYFRLSQLEVEC